MFTVYINSFVYYVICYLLCSGQQSYSSYAPYFIDPIFKKEQQEGLIKTGEAQKLAHIPIKAARNDDTCSVFHDELVRYVHNFKYVYTVDSTVHIDY
jgi:hypothetical protein